MAFKRKYGPFERKIEAGGETFTVLLDVPTYDDIVNPIAALRDGRVLAGWGDDVRDSDTGEPWPYTPENRLGFIVHTPIVGGLIAEMGKLYQDALSGELFRGNSKTPPAGSPVAAAHPPSADGA